MRSRLDKTSPSAKAATGRWRNALSLAALSLAALVFLIASASAQQIELQVDECGGDDSPDCSRSQEIQVEPEPAPETYKAEPTTETHEYDLRSGEGTITSGDEVEKETLDVDLGPAAEHDHEHDNHGGAEANGELPGTSDVGLAPVTTTGGSGFAGFGADFLSGDEALARFAVPPFLIPIYIAAGQAYDVPWNVLASINQIETDFGRIGQQVSYAGALGWMQFMPGTWRAYGVDASGDGIADPFNPVDAIYAAARYLSASGASTDLRRAVFAYNHADWYVDRVLQTASVYGSLPGGLVAETGSLAFGRFPLKGRVSYGDDFRRAQVEGGKPKGLWIEGRPEARAVATQNVKVVEIQLDQTLAEPFSRGATLADRGVQPERLVLSAEAGQKTTAARRIEPPRDSDTDLPKGYGIAPVPGVGVVVEDRLGNRYAYSGLERIENGIEPGARLRGGDTVGRIGPTEDSRMLFSVRAAGGAPVDPRPLVDGYRLQEAADFYHAIAPLAENPFVLAEGEALAGVTGSARELASRVLSASGIYIYPGGREDIRNGVIDKRVLGALLYLRRNGLELTITSLRSGHSFYTAGGGISAHSFGAAFDVAAFNGQSVLGHQGPGSLTEQAIKLLMRLQGNAQPAQLISLMNLGGPSFAMGDHHDHLHVGYSFQPSVGSGRSGDVLGTVDFDGGASPLDRADVDPALEQKLSGKLSAIENPSVSRDQGAGSLRVEAESPFDQSEAADGPTGPLAVQPAAAGAHVADVDVPAEGEAWAIGTVDGTGRPEWAAKQTVLTRFSGGVWEIVGPPVDARGRVANPDLLALATLPGGRGYAVGDDGAVVELRGGQQPRLLESVTAKRLNAVDVGGDRRNVSGFAVGAEGAVVRMTGGRAVAEHAGSSDLRAVLIDGASVLAAGGTGAGGVMRRSAGGWAPAGMDFGLPDGMRVRVTALDQSGGALWVAGSVADSTGTAAAELPFAATRVGDGWHTYCAGRPALAAVAELGTPTSRRVCSSGLTSDPLDTGAAADVAVTEVGTAVATARGIQVNTKDGFRPADAEPQEYAHLALGSSGRGWAVGADGALSLVRRTEDGTTGVDTVPLASGGELSSVAQSPSGDKLIAVASGQAAIREDGSWTPISAAPVGLVAAGFSGDEIWATTETGTLLRLDGGSWVAATGGANAGGGALSTLAHALGGDLVSRDVSGGAGEPASFAFSDGGTGVVGTDSGQVLRYAGDSWRLEETPAAVPIAAVAAGDEVTVAAGAQGVLVEDTGSGWTAPEEPRELAGGRAFTAADALDDGSVVAAAGGKVLARSTEDEWALTGLEPLGVPVRRIAGYRAGDELRVVALVGHDGQLGLLDGGTDGWRALELPAGLELVDFALDEESLQVSLIGYRDAAPVAAETELDSR